MDGRSTIEVLYSCNGCGIVDIKVTVKARTNEDVVQWVEQVMAWAINDDHSQRSPFCTERAMANVKIPVTGTDKIGGVPVH